jgi:hypothetical protein
MLGNVNCGASKSTEAEEDSLAQAHSNLHGQEQTVGPVKAQGIMLTACPDPPPQNTHTQAAPSCFRLCWVQRLDSCPTTTIPSTTRVKMAAHLKKALSPRYSCRN